MSIDNPERAAELLAALEEYRPARERLLSVLGPRKSNRDPLAEFAEHFVAALMGGQLAVDPVQAYWDIKLPDGTKVQVKYLVNTADPGSKAWVNEHLVRSLPGAPMVRAGNHRRIQGVRGCSIPAEARGSLPCPR